MRKKIFAVMIVAVVAAFAGYNVYQSQNVTVLSELALANMEALASGEYPGSPNAGSKCKGGPYMCYMGQGNVWGKY